MSGDWVRVSRLSVHSPTGNSAMKFFSGCESDEGLTCLCVFKEGSVECLNLAILLQHLRKVFYAQISEGNAKYRIA